MTGIEFVGELPPVAPFGKKNLLKPMVAPCMDHPGQWARLEYKRSSASPTVTRLRRGSPVFGSGVWEAAARTVDGVSYLYVRYMGPEA